LKDFEETQLAVHPLKKISLHMLLTVLVISCCTYSPNKQKRNEQREREYLNEETDKDEGNRQRDGTR
jgi:hypothetical protein